MERITQTYPTSIRSSPARFSAIFGAANLHLAWRKVRRNGGGAGGDDVTPDMFARNADVRLSRLAAELSQGKYRPGPLRRFRIRKRAGGWRELAVPCITDRVAQSAVLIALAPFLDARMAEESFAYRPGR